LTYRYNFNQDKGPVLRQNKYDIPLFGIVQYKYMCMIYYVDL